MKTDFDSFDIQRYLSVMPLFSALSNDKLERLAQGSELKRYARSAMVFRSGDACESLCVVIVGQVKLFALAPSGQEKVIEIIGPNQSFAEAMVFLDLPYSINVQSLSDTLLLMVSKNTVLTEIRQDPQFSLHLLAGMSRRLHGLVQDVEGYALRSGTQRLVCYLLRDVADVRQGQQGPITVSLPASKATIASRLSLTPEYFSRVLHELEAAQLIEIDKRDIRIPDVKRLAGYSAP